MRVEDVPSVSVVVPTHRRPLALRQTVEALLNLDYPNGSLEIVVVDDDGSGRAAETLDGMRDRGVVVRIENQSRKGAAAARNRGARSAEGDLLLFVDDDILVAPDHLRRHAQMHARHPGALVNGGWQFTPAVLQELSRTPFGRFRIELEQHFQREATGTSLDDGCVEMAMLGSWDLSVRRDAFWQLGGFDEGFLLAGAEDQDLSLRARAAGYRLLLDPGILCLHNDNRVDLLAYCQREERSAQTMPLLAKKYPSQFGSTPYLRENRPISRSDPPRLAAKKAVKWLLSRRLVLRCLHRLVQAAEVCRLPESKLRRAYTGLLGLYLFRGLRSTWPG